MEVCFAAFARLLLKIEVFQVCAAGFTAPPWAALVDAAQASDVSHFGDVARGWQQAAFSCLDQRALETLLSDLDSACRALLLSPTREKFTMPDDVARSVLLRRLRLPLPLSSRLCRCGGELDGLGDHRAACATAGVARCGTGLL